MCTDFPYFFLASCGFKPNSTGHSSSESSSSRTWSSNRSGNGGVNITDLFKGLQVGIVRTLFRGLRRWLSRMFSFAVKAADLKFSVLCYHGQSFHFLPMKGIAQDRFEFLDGLLKFASGFIGRDPRFQQISQRRFGRS